MTKEELRNEYKILFDKQSLNQSEYLAYIDFLENRIITFDALAENMGIDG